MNQQMYTAGAIVLGFAMVAAAILFSNHNLLATWFGPATAMADSQPERSGPQRLLYGNEQAETTIVEFSDFECPFCARVHPTIKRLVDESDGTIKWEYRHLPLPSHPNAFTAAVISECVGHLLGVAQFWEYADTVFANQRGLTTAYLRDVALQLGLEASTLDSCMANDDIAVQVQSDALTASAFGGNGTPFSVIVFPDGSTKPVSGALPYENWQAALNKE